MIDVRRKIGTIETYIQGILGLYRPSCHEGIVYQYDIYRLQTLPLTSHYHFHYREQTG